MNKKLYIALVIILLILNTKVCAKYIKNERTKIADINVEKTYSIVVKYIDVKSNNILESEIINKLKKGENYCISPKEIEGYYLESDSGNTSGIIEECNIEVNYYYRPNGVFAKCFDTSGNGKIDTLVLNDNPNFTYSGILINDFENKDNNDYQQNSTNNIPIWHDTLNQISKVVVLNNINPLNYTTRWFEYGNNIEQIDGLEKISTNQVKNMMLMFKYCEKLKSIDISNMNTCNVENMIGLFYRCYNLENVNLSNINTSKVTSMDVMFTDCEKIQQLNLSKFDTRNVTRMESMFCNCTNLISINLSSFNTEKVTTMIDMFSQCKKLQTLDISNYNTKNVTNMYGMFYNCSELKTIYIGEKWSTNKVNNSNIMFSKDYKLIGGKGTTYNGNYTDKTYAHDDGENNYPGYLTLKGTSKISNIQKEFENEKNEIIKTDNYKKTENEIIIIENDVFNNCIIESSNNSVEKTINSENTIKEENIVQNICK